MATLLDNMAATMVSRLTPIRRQRTAAEDDAQQRLIAYSQRLYPRYVNNRHHRLIAEHLEAVERRDIARLLIMMPPRHGKSELGSVNFPAWHLGRNPDQRVMLCSYGDSLARRFSRRARNQLYDSRYPFAGIRPARDSSAQNEWDIEGHRGGMTAAGVGGPITGKGADLLIIDDPVKNREEADSQTQRDHAWDWYTNDAYTRLEPNAAIVMIGTRWHEDDLIGRALNSDEEWTVLSLPAIAEDADPLGREPGEALWPDQFSAETLAKTRRQIGERAWVSLFQQRPAPDEGSILKKSDWAYFGRPLPEVNWLIQSWDTAFKKGDENSYSVGITMGISPAGFFVFDVWRDRAEYPDLKRAMRNQYIKWRPNEIIVEDKASGQSINQELTGVVDVGTTWNALQRLPLVPFHPDGDKTARAHAISPYVEGGQVHLLSGADWLEEFITEAAAFPLGKFNDQVDAFTMGMLRLIEQGRVIDAATPSEWRFSGLPGTAGYDQ